MIGVRRRLVEAAGWRVGKLATGEPLIIPCGLHLLIGGLSGTGKSSLLRCILARVCREPVALVLIDPKRVEFADWKARAETVAVEPDEITTALATLVAEMHRRYTVLADLGVNNWHPSAGPKVLAVIDELAGVVATGDRKADQENTVAIRKLLERGRACGIQLIAATQRPAADTIPTAIRDLFSTRASFASANETSTEMILGAAWSNGPAHELPLGEAHAGKCYVIGEGERTPRYARVSWLSPADARLYARNSAQFRPTGWALNLDHRSTPQAPIVEVEPDVDWLAALLSEPAEPAPSPPSPSSCSDRSYHAGREFRPGAPIPHGPVDTTPHDPSRSQEQSFGTDHLWRASAFFNAPTAPPIPSTSIGSSWPAPRPTPTPHPNPAPPPTPSTPPPAPAAPRPVARPLAGLHPELNPDQAACLDVLRQSGAPMSARNIYSIVRESRRLSNDRGDTALAALASADLIAKRGPVWTLL